MSASRSLLSIAPVTCLVACLLFLLALAPPEAAQRADPAVFNALAAEYARDVRPLIEQYCFKCHSGDSPEADLDLTRFKSTAEIHDSLKSWQKALEMLDSAQMPPKKAKQPSDEQRARLRTWVRAYLTTEARAQAGDPGPVILRRLSNAEYTYTIQDLTGIDSLQPAKEFPVDGAAGEGFTNTGQALVMSPGLLSKYLDAGKEVASHAMLLPDGMRFSVKTTRRDWTEEMLVQIRSFYGQFTETGVATALNLQGIKFATQDGGVLPLEKYLRLLLEERTSRAKQPASKSGLSEKYLSVLREAMEGKQTSLLLDPIRSRFHSAKPGDAAAIAGEIRRWQSSLWKFNPVGHIGREDGPKAWMEPVNPLQSRQEVRLKLAAAPEAKEIAIYLAASDAGDGNEHDFVIWQKPRLVAPGRPDLLLRDVREVTRDLAVRRQRMFAHTAKYLGAAAEAAAASGRTDLGQLAQKYDVEPEMLGAWLNYLGIGDLGMVKVTGHFSGKLTNASGYSFIQGWGSNDTPLLVANSSDQHVRIPGNMKPHSVAVHPSPTLQAAVGWQSPINATLRITGKVTHAHPECGNGVTWAMELRHGSMRRRLAAGTAQGSKEVVVGPFENVAVREGDLVSILIGPRDGNHSCDLTAVDLILKSDGENGSEWNLARDVSGDILAANPHADRFGNKGVWHFYTEPDKGGGSVGPVIPVGCVLARWQSANGEAERERLARDLQNLLISGPSAAKDGADAALYRQVASLGGPLLGGMLKSHDGAKRRNGETAIGRMGEEEGNWGLDPKSFGHHPRGGEVDDASLCVQAPSVIEIRLPADLAAGCEFITTGLLHQPSGAEGTVQLQVQLTRPQATATLQPDRPILVNESGTARQRVQKALDEYRNLFPAAVCYTRIVPVDEAVTLTLFYREDEHLRRLVLSDEQARRLDRMWDEFYYVSQEPLALVNAFEQISEFATQDRPDLVKSFASLRKPINDRAAAFRRRLVDTEPKHLEAVIALAGQAYRRPLGNPESHQIRTLYSSLRKQEIPHEEAIRLTLARVLVAPAFLYRAENPPSGATQGPVSDWELATRLSYFLWSSMPDDELRSVAASKRLHEPDVLAAQARRMLRDAKMRRLAIEFGCQWLHIRDFDSLDEKSERHFPTFAGVRGAMYEESIQFFTDLFQQNGRVSDILDADYTFLNEPLARHYGIPGVSGAEWRRVEGVKKYSRGGILGLATTLAKQSGASRTSPILRGNWVSETLLGEKLPRPPKDVPRLPEDETATDGLTVRQLVEKHTSDPKCFTCHRRIDPYGYALESFDAIGRLRDNDLGGRPLDTRVVTMDGARFEGLGGLRNYLLTTRRDAFLRQFCRKLLGYALGREVRLSDEPLLEDMETHLKSNDDHLASIVQSIVQSRQFCDIRGRETTLKD